MRRCVSAVRVGFVAGAAALITLGLAAPLIAQPAAGASAGTVRVTPRSLADDTVLGVFSSVGGGVNDTVAALAVGGDDTVYAGGYFTSAGGNAGITGIAAWSNRDDTWHALGGGMGGVVNALAVNGDDSLYAGGEFCSEGRGCGTGAGGVAGTNGIATWSNTDDTWHALGQGMVGRRRDNATLWSFAVQGRDTLYAGGMFASASGVSNTQNIAAWSNADDTWRPLGAGTNSSVRALATHGDDTVYAGGNFGDASARPGTMNVAAWSNADDTWHSLGQGMSNPVSALAATRDDTLYAGGEFFSASGVAGTTYIAAWSNADDTWHALGSGTNNQVMALALDDRHGLLYAGGDFTAAGTVPASRVAVWDTGLSAWIPLQAVGGNGVEALTQVMALAVDDSVAYVGGSFTSAGGVAGTARIAKWTWDAPLAEAVPASGARGAPIQLRGSGLIGVKGANAVRVNGSPVPYTRDDSTTISLTIPGGLYDGSYPIAVDAVGGTGVATYTVTGSPAPTPPPPPVTYPPGVPTGAIGVAGDRSALVSWVAPTSAGSFPVSNYQVTAAPGGRSCLVSVPALTCEVSGLTNGTSYTFTVRALNGAGWGADSASSNAVTPSASTTKSIVITGSRNPAVTRFVRVMGVTTGLVGEQVTPFVRFAGESEFSPGKVTRLVAADGTFEWARGTARKVDVYFTHGSVRSNTATIPAR